MGDENESAERQRLKQGVFQPSRAQIAREMKCRLGFCGSDGKPAKQQKSR